LNLGYKQIIESDFETYRKWLTGCDIWWLISNHPECNLALTDSEFRNTHPDDLWWIKNPDEAPNGQNPFTYNFAYETAGFICGFRLTELQRAFPLEAKETTKDDQKFEDRTC